MRYITGPGAVHRCLGLHRQGEGLHTPFLATSVALLFLGAFLGTLIAMWKQRREGDLHLLPRLCCTRAPSCTTVQGCEEVPSSSVTTIVAPTASSPDQWSCSSYLLIPFEVH